MRLHTVTNESESRVVDELCDERRVSKILRTIEPSANAQQVWAQSANRRIDVSARRASVGAGSSLVAVEGRRVRRAIPLAAIADTVTSPIARAGLGSATGTGAQTLLCRAWHTELPFGELRRRLGSSCSGRRLGATQVGDVACGPSLAARDHHLSVPLSALVTRSGGTRSAAAHAFGFERCARRLQHFVSSTTHLSRLVPAVSHAPVTAHSEQLRATRRHGQAHRVRTTRACAESEGERKDAARP